MCDAEVDGLAPLVRTHVLSRLPQIRQVDVPPTLQIQILVPECAAFTLAATRIGGPSLANPAQPRNNRAPGWLRRQFLLHQPEDSVSILTGQLVQAPRKGARFDEYHKVLYTTAWDICQETSELGDSSCEEVPLPPMLVSKERPDEGPGLERGAGNHGRIESGRLALPDVLAAGARHCLRGMFLCHRLPAYGTICAPHIGSAFSSTNTVQRPRARHA